MKYQLLEDENETYSEMIKATEALKENTKDVQDIIGKQNKLFKQNPRSITR